MNFRTLILGGLIAFLPACSHNIQTTSGQEYLNKYAESDAYQHMSATDAEIYEIANIEPDLKFPARIGLARIADTGSPYHSNLNLTSIPVDEAEIWRNLVEREGHRYGEFVPVSPLVTELVAGKSADNVKSIVRNIRKGAARQHLDYVLIYEIISKDKRTSNDLGFTDATVLGLFLVPSRKVEVDTVASAILIDVRNGYPYATATSYSEFKSTTTKSAARSKRIKLEDKARVDAIKSLSSDVENALQDLKDEAYNQLVAEGF